MDRKEAILRIKEHMKHHGIGKYPHLKLKEALDMAIAALSPPNEPLPVLVNDEPDREYIDYICPRCKNTISQRRRGQRMETVYKCKFHDNCGQRVDWSNPQPYRRPPEGDCEIKACAETCDECGFCDNTLASPPEEEENA